MSVHPGCRIHPRASATAATLAFCVGLAGCAASRPRAPLPPPSLPLVVTPDAPFRAQRPPLPPASSASSFQRFPEIQAAALENGLVVWVVHRPQLPYVMLSLVTRTLGTLDSTLSPELLGVTARTVIGATVWFDGRPVEPPTVNGQGVGLVLQPTYGAFQLQVLRSALPGGMQVLGRTVRFPALDPASVDVARLSEARSIQDDSSSISDLMWQVTSEAACGESISNRIVPHHIQEVRDSEVSTVKSYHASLFRPDVSALIAVGDVSLVELLALTQKEFGGWARGTQPIVPPQKAEFASQGRTIHLFRTREKDQAEVMVLQPAPPGAASEDILPFAVLSEIAVGAFHSRLSTRLRHETGTTYGVHPRIVRGHAVGLFAIKAAIERSEVASSIEQFSTALESLQKVPVLPTELDGGKLAVGAWFENQASSNEKMASFLADQFAEGRSTEWIGSLPERLAAVRGADIVRVARQYLRPDDLEVGVYGSGDLYNELSFLGRTETYRYELE